MFHGRGENAGKHSQNQRGTCANAAWQEGSLRQEAKSILVSFEERYPGVTNQENVNDILAKARAKAASRESLLDELKAKRKSDRDAR